MKKVLSYFFLILLIIGGIFGVYLFVTKGYPNKQTNLVDIVENVVDNNIEEEKASDELEAVTSNKISLVITSPKNGAKLNSTNVNVIGKTAPNAEVFVNDAEGKADVNGNFSISLGLDEGVNQLVIDANDKEGNVAEQVIIVTVSSFE